MVKEYKEKASVKAVQWTGDNLKEITDFAQGAYVFNRGTIELRIGDGEGYQTAEIGDYVVTSKMYGFIVIVKKDFESAYKEA